VVLFDIFLFCASLSLYLALPFLKCPFAAGRCILNFRKWKHWIVLFVFNFKGECSVLSASERPRLVLHVDYVLL
jgi:hypothetical protein